MVFDQQRLESLVAKNDDAPLKLCFHIFDTLPSTNQKLWEFIDQGAKPGTVVIAAQQTAGRGQWGRQWNSSLGGLYLSLAIAPNLPLADSAQLTLCSAWGIATALRDHHIPVFLKWPNDLILLNRKLGGILIETKVQQGHIAHAVIGVGINWTNPVPEIGINLKSFWNTQPTPSITSLESLAAITLQGLLSGCQRSTPEGIKTVLPSYLELLSSWGRSVVVDGCPGVVVGVTPTGNLQVQLHSGVSTSAIEMKPGAISLGYER